ncbi:restriction endonuclease subunit S [Streptomyces sp. TRM68367]|uniref:restriction endonuclease subunit S n=1 Tax=Streptomyces sp. TRM68367 TaxID=2758415 RepID=UPI00165B5172|nr:restriction endonuclease subunit S [Streptomyces sp. TRM68367]MBC9728822.1 restriction endonuclease subunit S [Streptomyces sp. TRM68367]
MSGLPSGWVRVRLDEIAEVQGGIQKQQKRRPVDNKFPFLRVANVASGSLDLRDVHEIELFGGELERFVLRPGDLLVVEGNGSVSQLGRAARWNGEIENCVHQNHLIRVRPGPAISTRFLELLWNSPVVSEQLRSVAASTSGLHTLSTAKLKRVCISLPPLEEQRRIVAALEEQLSRLDAAQGNAADMRRKLLAYKASREREIVPSPSPDVAEKVLPKEWRMVGLGDISHSSGYGTSTKCGYDGTGSPVLRIPNIQSGSIDAADLKYALDSDLDLQGYKVRAGDLLVVRTNGSRDLIGRVAVSQQDTDYAFASYLIRFRINTDISSPTWVAKVLSTRSWRRLIEAAAASTAGQYNLNLKKLASLPIPLPPLQQQHSLAAALDEIDESVRRLTSAVDDASLKGDALRRSLLVEAFAGRLVPQNPADDPADALLDRIRAEREAAEATKPRRRSPRRTPAQRKRTPDTAQAPDAPPPPPADAPALATATQPTLDMEIPS